VTIGTLDATGGVQFAQPLFVGLGGACGMYSPREYNAKEQGDRGAKEILKMAVVHFSQSSIGCRRRQTPLATERN
jgi:hypothetical protein